jgi:hypothetical protein
MNSVLSKALAAAGTSNQAVQASATGNTYWNILDSDGVNPGAFKNFIPAGNGEVNLAALVAPGGTASLDLYYYPNATANIAGTGLAVADITIGNGSTQIHATPIPATFLLFGSGLLGLVRIRRKQAV